jgi:hypothetical protein
MVACVRDPIDRWGGGQAPIHQVKSTNCTPPTPRDHVGQKRRKYAHDQVRGWGGRRNIYPRPRQVKSRHVTTPISPTCEAALQKILTNQSKHMYLLTRLSASQTATWHVYFRIYHTYKSTLTISERGTWAAVEERKEPPARGTPHALDRLIRSRKVYS